MRFCYHITEFNKTRLSRNRSVLEASEIPYARLPSVLSSSMDTLVEASNSTFHNLTTTCTYMYLTCTCYLLLSYSLLHSSCDCRTSSGKIPMASIALTLLVSLASAQFPPKPEGVKVLRSKHHDGVTLSYKEPGLCETTPGVKSYAG